MITDGQVTIFVRGGTDYALEGRYALWLKIALKKLGLEVRCRGAMAHVAVT